MTTFRFPSVLAGAATLALMLAAPGHAQQEATEEQRQPVQALPEALTPGNTAEQARNEGAAEQVLQQLEDAQYALELGSVEAAREALAVAYEMLQKAVIEGEEDRLVRIGERLEQARTALQAADVQAAEAAIGAAAEALVAIDVAAVEEQNEAAITVIDENATEAAQRPPAVAEGADEALSTEETYRLLGTGDREIGQAVEMLSVPIAELRGRKVVTFDGEKIGEIDHFVTSGGNIFAVIEHGGFLGIGEDRVAVPSDRLGVRGERIVLLGLSEEQLERIPEYDVGSAQELNENQAIELGRYN